MGLETVISVDMTDISSLFEEEIDRRRIIGAAGTVIAGGLAGCSGTGDDDPGSSSGETDTGDGSSTPEQSDSTDSPTETDPTPDGQENTTTGNDGSEGGNEPGNYPTQDMDGIEAEINQNVDENEITYGFKIEDYDFLNVEEFPDITDDYEASTINELARSDEEFSLDQALYLAANMETPDGQASDTIYFAGEADRRTGMAMYVNIEDREEATLSELQDKEGVSIHDLRVVGIPNADTSEERRRRQEEFLSGRIDPDGIVYAVDLAEHDYAVEALHSGWSKE